MFCNNRKFKAKKGYYYYYVSFNGTPHTALGNLNIYLNFMSQLLLNTS
jgi:hypothetical protein